MNNLHITDEYNFLKTGDKLPEFSWKDENGQEFSSDSLLGKYSLIIFFAIDCRYCKYNFAYLEKNLFSKKNSGFNILAIGRGCDVENLKAYQLKYSLSIKLAPDPEKEIYSKFAEKAVPRVYLFDRTGKLQISIRGFRTEGLDAVLNTLLTD